MAREAEPVGPVPIEHVEAVLPRLPRPVAAMVRLQLLCGCRAGEVMVMRGCDLTPGDPVWEYRPARHKNSWRGKGRVILLGPKAQEIVREFLKPDLTAYLFSPADVVEEMHARRRASRKSKPTPSELARRCEGTPGQKHNHRYRRGSYLQRPAGEPEKSRGLTSPTRSGVERSPLAWTTAQPTGGGSAWAPTTTRQSSP
jgi:integrase